MLQLKTLLDGVLEARGKVLVKLNVGRADLDAVIALLPSMKSPTVSELFGDGGYAVETVVAKTDINTLIPALKDAGASDIIELPLVEDRPLTMRGTVTDVRRPARARHGHRRRRHRLPVPLHRHRRRHPHHRGRHRGRASRSSPAAWAAGRRPASSPA